MGNSQSKLRPGSDDHFGFGIEILRAFSFGHGFSSCFSLQVFQSCTLHHWLLHLCAHTTVIMSQLKVSCYTMTINLHIQQVSVSLTHQHVSNL